MLSIFDRKQLAEQKAQLTEQKAQLEQKNAQLNTSVQLLYKSGLSIEAIAEQLGMTTDDVRCLVQCPTKSLGFSTEEIEKL